MKFLATGLGMLLALKTFPVVMSQFTSVSISASVLNFVLFVSDKSGCLSSFCSVSSESFPSNLTTLANAQPEFMRIGYCIATTYKHNFKKKSRQEISRKESGKDAEIM